MTPDSLPLFPLNTVLFPGGLLPLRIFEPRYLDLIRDSARAGSGFGICLILDGREVGEPATPAALGCEARIVDFATTAEGLLGITVQGGRRFHVMRSRARDNGLVVAEVTWLAEEASQRVLPEHGLLASLLQRLQDRADLPYEKTQLQDAGWVSWRLAEWLPLTMPQRQLLLQESDPHRRLQWLLEQVPQFQSD